jgi:hypothetical protein
MWQLYCEINRLQSPRLTDVDQDTNDKLKDLLKVDAPDIKKSVGRAYYALKTPTLRAESPLLVPVDQAVLTSHPLLVPAIQSGGVGAAIWSGIVGADIQSGSVSSHQGPGHCVGSEFRDKGMWQAWRRFHVPPRIGRDRNVPAVRAMLQTGRISAG